MYILHCDRAFLAQKWTPELYCRNVWEKVTPRTPLFLRFPYTLIFLLADDATLSFIVKLEGG